MFELCPIPGPLPGVRQAVPPVPGALTSCGEAHSCRSGLSHLFSLPIPPHPSGAWQRLQSAGTSALSGALLASSSEEGRVDKCLRSVQVQPVHSSRANEQGRTCASATGIPEGPGEAWPRAAGQAKTSKGKEIRTWRTGWARG